MRLESSPLEERQRPQAPFEIPLWNNLLRALPPLRFQLCTILARAACSGRREAGKNNNQYQTPAGLK